MPVVRHWLNGKWIPGKDYFSTRALFWFQKQKYSSSTVHMRLFTVTILCCVTFALQPINSNMSLTHCSACIFFLRFYVFFVLFFLCCFFFKLMQHIWPSSLWISLRLWKEFIKASDNANSHILQKLTQKVRVTHSLYQQHKENILKPHKKKKNLITLALPNLSALVCKSFFFLRLACAMLFLWKKWLWFSSTLISLKEWRRQVNYLLCLELKKAHL